MDWKDFALPSEIERLSAITREREYLADEHRQIYIRCRKRAQKALGGVELKTGRGDTFLIDPADLERVAPYRWQSVSTHNGTVMREAPYVAATIGGRRVLIHRFITNAPPNTHVDHIDGDTLNNCRANLRVGTPSENQKSGHARRAKIGL